MSGAKRLDALDAIDVGALVQSAVALPAGTSMADAQQTLDQAGESIGRRGSAPTVAPVATGRVAWNSVPADSAQAAVGGGAVARRSTTGEAVLSDIPSPARSGATARPVAELSLQCRC